MVCALHLLVPALLEGWNVCLLPYYSPKPTIVPDPHTQQGHDNHSPKAEWRLQEAPARRGTGAQAPLSACSSLEPTCCAGWKQQGDECGIGEWDILGTWAVGAGAVGGGWRQGSSGPLLSAAVCEGNSTCSENEVCVRPGECRCRHGYFGANCDTSERWAVGLDPRELGVACERGGV